MLQKYTYMCMFTCACVHVCVCDCLYTYQMINAWIFIPYILYKKVAATSLHVWPISSHGMWKMEERCNCGKRKRFDFLNKKYEKYFILKKIKNKKKSRFPISMKKNPKWRSELSVSLSFLDKIDEGCKRADINRTTAAYVGIRCL